MRDLKIGSILMVAIALPAFGVAIWFEDPNIHGRVQMPARFHRVAVTARTPGIGLLNERL